MQPRGQIAVGSTRKKSSNLRISVAIRRLIDYLDGRTQGLLLTVPFDDLQGVYSYQLRWFLF